MADALTVRPATQDDVEFVWQVNNEPAVRAQSIRTDPIPWESHQHWFAASLQSESRALLIAMAAGDRVGTVRFDLDGADATISVAVAPEFRGHGYGVKTIVEGCRLIARRGVERVEALIRPENAASLAAFARAGFEDTHAPITENGVELERFVWHARGD